MRKDRPFVSFILLSLSFAFVIATLFALAIYGVEHGWVTGEGIFYFAVFFIFSICLMFIGYSLYLAAISSAVINLPELLPALLVGGISLLFLFVAFAKLFYG